MIIYIPTQEELTRIKKIKDEDINLSDAPESDVNFWQNAQKISKNNEQNFVILNTDVAS